MRAKALLVAGLATATIGIIGGTAPVYAEAPETNSSTATEVTVQPGDYLAKIADEHETVYTRLFDANTTIQDPNVIHPGDKIKIPAADEQIPSRALPSASTSAAQLQAPVATTAPAPAARQSPPAPSDSSADGGVWDRLAACESGGNWSINTGNGYYGGLQFSARSWQAVGGTGLPSEASRSEQIARAEALKARQGWGAWPACTSKLGLR